MENIGGITSAANMPKSCGMEGMHGGGVNKQSANHQHTEVAHQNHITKNADPYRGQTVDMKA